ncbi:hypothetical protein BD769DRAFT_1658778 [Suillus cothurnatus]|nr:hypothetical protein BD769DRAFT_1658778 [Suillus cothurnatus]
MSYATGSVLCSLATVFNGSGAFIFIERQQRGTPTFHIVRADEITNAPYGPVLHSPASSVLVITENVRLHPDILSDTVSLLAHNYGTQTACIESVELAEYLVSEARVAYSSHSMLPAK